MTGQRKRGWSSDADLPIVHSSEARYWSIAEAARLLGPPQLTDIQVRSLVHMLNILPKGKRSNGPRRRHVRVYDALELIEAYDRLYKVTDK